LKNDFLDKRHDGAVLNLTGKTAFTTDSFVITPIFFLGGNIGELAINGTVNDLAMCGAIPQYLSLGFILEEGLIMKEFWEILVFIKFACKQAGVQVVTGDTKVVDRGKGDKIFINTTGIGQIHPAANIDISKVKVGDKIIVSDNLVTHGIDKVEAIANKVRNEEEEAIREYCKKIDLPIAVIIPFDEQVTNADLIGLSIMDYDENSKVVVAIEELVNNLDLN